MLARILYVLNMIYRIAACCLYKQVCLQEVVRLKLLIKVCSVGDIDAVILPTALRACKTLQVGLRTREVVASYEKQLGEYTLTLHATTAQELGLVDGMRLGFFRDEEILILGPAVGVLMSKGRLRRLRIGESHFRITALVDANRSVGCLLYFFTIGDLDWDAGQVQGVYYDYEQESWREQTFPIFSILYDRGGGFTPKQRIVAHQLRDEIKEHQTIKQLNCVYHFDKWDQYQRLVKLASMRASLPYTRRGTSKNISDLFNKYNTVYVKGRLGSNGLEVMRVDKVPNGFFYAYVDSKKTEVTGVAESISELGQEIRKFLGSKRSIVQQGIRVLQHDGHNLDFRVLMQRDEIGAWRLTDAPVRVSLTGAISSTRSGSTVYQFQQACSELLGMTENQIEELYERLHAFGMNAVAALEQAYGRFGELGIDVALDNDYKMWFIEANSKPGKDTVLMAGKAELAELAFARPLHYCRYLAGFPASSVRPRVVRHMAWKVRRWWQ